MRKFLVLFLLSAFAACSVLAQNAEPVATQTDSLATPKEQSDAARAALEIRETNQLASVRGLQFSLTKPDGNPVVEAFDGSKEQHPQLLRLKLANWSRRLLVNYRFQGQANFLPLDQEAASKGVPIPANVDLIVVNLVWCDNSCPGQASTAPPPDPCVQSQQTAKINNAIASQLQNGDAIGAATDQHRPDDQKDTRCQINVVFTRDLVAKSSHLGSALLPAFIITKNGLEISDALLEESKYPENASFVLNGTPIREYFSLEHGLSRTTDLLTGESYVVRESLFGWTSVRSFRIERYPFSKACHPDSSTDAEWIDVDRPGTRPAPLGKDNGIHVAPSKVFDTYTLRQMLAATASQLAGISGFNSASITSAYGSLQGVTRDTSYLSAQVTTVPTAAISSVIANGSTGSNTAANTLTLTNGATGTSTVISCPPGTLPSVGTSGVPACAPLTTATSGASTGVGYPNGGASTINTGQSNFGSTLNSANTGAQTSNQQNTLTTSSGGQAGTVAPVPVSTALAPPTNVGVSASDMLAEQVQLNSQITTLRLLLQGALSDQYIVKNSFATDTRQQTTVGFAIGLNPPQRFRHAVAEVKIWIDSPRGKDEVSIMNLLPADKTYNVAKITSHQNQFGAGAVIEMVNVGVATGKSKDRLYLAKDTDTVALQFPRDKPESVTGADRVPRSIREHIGDYARQARIWQGIEDACTDDPHTQSDSVVFGWQFRPVLGADYVQAGQRMVYAQLALPTGLGEQFAPVVHIQTRWREYDSNRRVVGAVYEGSCSISEDSNPITVLSPLRVQDASWDDMGNGLLKMSARGNFFASGFTALTGPNTITPATFDGKSVEVFANATNLLMADDLKLVGEDGRTTNLGMRSRFGITCDISSAQVSAIPRPDGTSLVEATFSSGPNFSLDFDKAPRPLFLIGTQVYGLHETPFIDTNLRGDRCGPTLPGGQGVTCQYHFIAPTTDLRAAETYTVRDLSWKEFKHTGPVTFAPSFTGLTILGTKPANVTAICPSTAAITAAACTPPPLYSLTGFDFDQLTSQNCQTAGCFEVYEGLDAFPLAATNFQTLSKTTAVLQLSRPVAPAIAYDYKALRFIWHISATESMEWDLSVPQEAKVPVTASAILNVGDSTQIIFSGVDIIGTKPLRLVFDNVVVDPSTYSYDIPKKALTVAITTSMTSKPGHKEMTLSDSVTAPGAQKPKSVQLPFEVTKR
jgi:hypothetical protein